MIPPAARILYAPSASQTTDTKHSPVSIQQADVIALGNVNTLIIIWIYVTGSAYAAQASAREEDANIFLRAVPRQAALAMSRISHYQAGGHLGVQRAPRTLPRALLPHAQSTLPNANFHSNATPP